MPYIRFNRFIFGEKFGLTQGLGRVDSTLEVKELSQCVGSNILITWPSHAFDLTGSANLLNGAELFIYVPPNFILRRIRLLKSLLFFFFSNFSLLSSLSFQ